MAYARTYCSERAILICEMTGNMGNRDLGILSMRNLWAFKVMRSWRELVSVSDGDGVGSFSFRLRPLG